MNLHNITTSACACVTDGIINRTNTYGLPIGTSCSLCKHAIELFRHDSYQEKIVNKSSIHIHTVLYLMTLSTEVHCLIVVAVLMWEFELCYLLVI